jgi:alcohol dehydrogenase (NADP+)
MPYPEEAQGFQVDSAATWTDFHKRYFKLKPLSDYDVDIKVDACGVCGSDVHTISGGWGDQHYPLAVGHEVIGTAIRVGSKVTLVKRGGASVSVRSLSPAVAVSNARMGMKLTALFS